MPRKQENLLSPMQLGNLTLKNRIISAPMTYPILTADGCLTPEAVAFYELRAKGGAAVVTVSELIVDSERGKYYPVQVTMDSPSAKASLAAAARAVRRHGAVASMELSHGGRFALSGGVTWGPSDIFENGKLITQKITKLMIDEVIGMYARAASLCRDAGFEMLLIHAGHGWLLEQFLSPAMNTRDDQYGGSLKNRARLALEVISAVRETVGPCFPIELRISAEEYIDDGYSTEDITEFAQLAEDKIDLLQVSTGSHKNSFDKTHLSMFAERGANVIYAEEMKKHIRIPVAAIGALNEPAMLEDIIASGKADAVVMGRALLADPYLPRKIMEGREDEIVRCCRCFVCMAERLLTGLRICALNPVIGSEYEHLFMPAPTAVKKVLIAGGGPGGMQCAITAAERGHEVILCEKTDMLGGALNCERGVSFKSDLYGYIKTKSLQMERAGVDVRLNSEVTHELAAEIAPDVLIIAAGAEPIVPTIRGIERAIIADGLPDTADIFGRKVVIVGGGLVGCETAVHLAREGCHVTVVEMGSSLCADANPRHRPLLIAELEKSAASLTNTRVVEITDEGIVCETAKGTLIIPADKALIAVGRRARSTVVNALRDCAPIVEIIGDCVKPGNVTDATFRGHYAALGI